MLVPNTGKLYSKGFCVCLHHTGMVNKAELKGQSHEILDPRFFVKLYPWAP
jgi:hypothetical protein